MDALSPETRNLITSMLLLAALCLVVAVGIQLIKMARRRLGTDDHDPRENLAETVQIAYESGQIGDDEYQRLLQSVESGGPLRRKYTNPSPSPSTVDPNPENQLAQQSQPAVPPPSESQQDPSQTRDVKSENEDQDEHAN